MERLLECVPNISEGKSLEVIHRIITDIESVNGVKVIHTDRGEGANRTVITFVGEPEKVCEAAFRMVKTASQLIDMSRHKGTHPRSGAVDVLPLVPLKGISMEETVLLAHQLGKRIGDELGIPGYFYEYACTTEERRNLATCRSGEYEGLPEKLKKEDWKPDFGTNDFNDIVKKSGTINLGARKILIAYNINIDTKSIEIANYIASQVREKGVVERENDPIFGKIIKDENGKAIYKKGLLKGVKGLGWYIEEYDRAQLSYNITDIDQASIQQVFEFSKEKAALLGVKVTGSELIGLIPLDMLLSAGKYFLGKEKLSINISEEEIVDFAVKSLGLDELAPFNPKERVIEYLIKVYK